MHISRRQSFIFTALALLLFFALSIILVKRNAPPARETRAAAPQEQTPVGEAKQNATFKLQEFHRSEVKDGRTLWEIHGSAGEFYPESNSTKIADGTLSLYKSNGDVVKMLAKEALLHLNGAAFDRVDVSNGATLIFNDRIHLETNSAIYQRSENSVQAPGAVTITSERMQITGDGLKGNVETQEFTLLDNVSTVIEPGKKK